MSKQTETATGAGILPRKRTQDQIETLQMLFEDICDDAKKGSEAQDTRHMREYLESILVSAKELQRAIGAIG